jgi:hypothetical protein
MAADAVIDWDVLGCRLQAGEEHLALRRAGATASGPCYEKAAVQHLLPF